MALAAHGFGTGDDVTMTFGGNATMLLRIGGFTLLTDPNFLHRGQRARLGYGLRAKRLTEPALQPTQLPALDGILLSHMHGDHWDRIATKSLPKDTPVVTTPEAAKCLADRGFTGRRTCSLADPRFTRGGDTLRITSVPGVHGPGPLAQLLPQVMGSVLELVRGEGGTCPGGATSAATRSTGPSWARCWSGAARSTCSSPTSAARRPSASPSPWTHGRAPTSSSC